MTYHAPAFLSRMALAAMLFTAAPLAVQAQDTSTDIAPETVVARVDGTEITQADLTAAISDLGEEMQGKSPDEAREYALTYLIDLELISRRAREAGLDKDPAYAARVAYLERKALLVMHLDRIGEEAANDEAAKALYEKLVSEAPKEKEVSARHILVATEEEAKAVIKELEAGGDFAEIAKEKSTDPGSGPDGGDLGFFTKERMVPEFANAAFAMKPGEISEPVQSQFGWHVIKVEDEREQQPPAFEDVKTQVMQMVAQSAQRDEVLGAREKADIERIGAEAEKAGEGADKEN